MTGCMKRYVFAKLGYLKDFIVLFLSCVKTYIIIKLKNANNYCKHFISNALRERRERNKRMKLRIRFAKLKI